MRRFAQNSFTFPLIALCFLSFHSSVTGCAQRPIRNVVLDKGGVGYPPAEPSIAISPKDPSVIVAGAITNKVYVSRDGGRTWTKDQLKSTHGVFGDPCIIADAEGRFYYLHLSDPSGKGWADSGILDRIVVQRSDDNGEIWSDGGFMGLRPPKDQDKEWAIIDPRNQHLYATWTEFDKYNSKNPDDKSRILFSKSTDLGETWSDGVAINELDGDCIDDDNTVEGAVPGVGANSEIYVAWSYREKIYFDRSKDGGVTWLDSDRVVADQPGGWAIDIEGVSRANGMPILACDLSDSPHRGNLYVNWCDQRNGESDTDVWLAKSKDEGETWSPPIRVNDDPEGKQQFFTWMAVDPKTGVIYCVFYDRRDHPGNETDVWVAYSEDGGESFHNVKISSSPFTTREDRFMGDYNNIDAYDGRIACIWTRMNPKGQSSIWASVFDHDDLKNRK